MNALSQVTHDGWVKLLLAHVNNVLTPKHFILLGAFDKNFQIVSLRLFKCQVHLGERLVVCGCKTLSQQQEQHTADHRHRNWFPDLSVAVLAHCLCRFLDRSFRCRVWVRLKILRRPNSDARKKHVTSRTNVDKQRQQLAKQKKKKKKLLFPVLMIQVIFFSRRVNRVLPFLRCVLFVLLLVVVGGCNGADATYTCTHSQVEYTCIGR